MDEKKKEFFERFTLYNEAHFQGFIKVVRNGKVENMPFTPDLVWDWIEEQDNKQREEFVEDLEEEMLWLMPDDAEINYEEDNYEAGRRDALLDLKKELISKYKKNEE